MKTQGRCYLRTTFRGRVLSGRRTTNDKKNVKLFFHLSSAHVCSELSSPPFDPRVTLLFFFVYLSSLGFCRNKPFSSNQNTHTRQIS